jgi:hypothetical protein
MALDVSHSQGELAARRQTAECLASGELIRQGVCDSQQMRIRYRHAVCGEGYHLSALPEIVLAGVEDRPEQPGASIANAMSVQEIREEHLMRKRLGLYAADLKTLHGDADQQRKVLLIDAGEVDVGFDDWLNGIRDRQGCTVLCGSTSIETSVTV